MRRLQNWLHAHVEQCESSVKMGHLFYFTAVSIDGHGSYAYAATVMLALILVTMWAGGEED